MPSIWTILDWIFYGLIRYVLYLIPLIRAPEVDRGPPSSWWRYNNYYDWREAFADAGRPNEHWCRSWLEMAFGDLQRVATDKARPYVDAAKRYLLGVVGGIRGGFWSMGAWVDWLQRAVGYTLPFFAANLAGAATWLYGKLPLQIRAGWQDWWQLFEETRAMVRKWVMSRYDGFRAWTDWLVSWITGIGESIRQWVARNAAWVDEWRQNPYGRIVGLLGPGWGWLLAFRDNAVTWIVGWLGDDWRRVVEFARGPLTFYYNLWSWGWRTLSDFVADPRSFVLDRLEQAVMDRW